MELLVNNLRVHFFLCLMQVHFHILACSQHLDHIKTTNPRIGEFQILERHQKEFAHWFLEYVSNIHIRTHPPSFFLLLLI